MIIDIPSEAIKVEDLLDTKFTLPLSFQDLIQKECGRLILVDEMLQSENYRPHINKMALHLLKLESDMNIRIEPSNVERTSKFIDRMLSEAKSSPSRHALELLASMNSLIEEFSINPYLSESSHVLMTFVRNFQRFARHTLEFKLMVEL